jgi:hypothetical protein
VFPFLEISFFSDFFFCHVTNEFQALTHLHDIDVIHRDVKVCKGRKTEGKRRSLGVLQFWSFGVSECWGSGVSELDSDLRFPGYEA